MTAIESSVGYSNFGGRDRSQSAGVREVRQESAITQTSKLYNV
jgi:hypothetical protein